MSRFLVTADAISEFLRDIRSEYAGAGKLYLIGESSQVLEGWRRWTDAVDFCVEVEHRADFHRAAVLIARSLGVRMREEDPNEVIPLPEGRFHRARSVDRTSKLQIWHYDPYSVAFRSLARGDEPDYHLVLSYIEHGWISVEEMTRLLDELMPRFSMQTIQQDPAEFRRRYKGLLQMVGAKLRVAGSDFRTAQPPA